MKNFNIDMPSDLEIESQINFIVDNGIKKKESFYSHVINMYKSIGIKNLFHDISELTFVSVLCISILGLMAVRLNQNVHLSRESIYAFVFMISPLFYFATNVFSFINMKESNTYQVEMVCKYNVYQISSLRMLVFSTACILVNTAIVIVISNNLELMKGIMISITSLFLFSTIFLYAALSIKKLITKYAVILGWIVLNGALCITDIKIYNHILSTIPNYVYGIVSLGCILIYLNNIKKLSGYKKIINEI